MHPSTRPAPLPTYQVSSENSRYGFNIPPEENSIVTSPPLDPSVTYRASLVSATARHGSIVPTIRRPAPRSTFNPQSHRESRAQLSRNSSIAPSSRSGSAVPSSRGGSVVPSSRGGSIAPSSRGGSIPPSSGSRSASVVPPFRSTAPGPWGGSITGALTTPQVPLNSPRVSVPSSRIRQPPRAGDMAEPPPYQPCEDDDPPQNGREGEYISSS